MATLDILSPLAGDTISADNVHVMVAYNFQAHYRASVRIHCQFAGASTYSDVDSATPGTVDFSLGTVPNTGDQTVRVWCTSPDLEDYEYPVHVGVPAGDPYVTVEPPPPPPPPLPIAAAGGPATRGVLKVSGTHRNRGSNTVEVRAYGLNPSGQKADGVASPTKSKKPFGTKFTPRSAHTPVADFAADGTWSVNVSAAAHPHQYTIRANMSGSKNQQYTRGRY